VTIFWPLLSFFYHFTHIFVKNMSFYAEKAVFFKEEKRCVLRNVKTQCGEAENREKE